MPSSLHRKISVSAKACTKFFRFGVSLADRSSRLCTVVLNNMVVAVGAHGGKLYEFGRIQRRIVWFQVGILESGLRQQTCSVLTVLEFIKLVFQIYLHSSACFLQLGNTKAVDPSKGTLLHFLVDLIDKEAIKSGADPESSPLWNVAPELESTAAATRGNQRKWKMLPLAAVML